MAKKHILFSEVHKHLKGLKALVGFNIVPNFYLDETDLMMMVSFHKIDKYKDLKPLTIQFTREDFEEDPVVINTTIAGQVKMYMEGRLIINNDEDIKNETV